MTSNENVVTMYLQTKISTKPFWLG